MGSRITRQGISSAAVDAAIAAAKPAFGYGETIAHTNAAGTIPADDTIPQNTEGVEILSASITLKSASSKVEVIVHVCGAATAGAFVCFAVFRDSGADAIFSDFQRINGDINAYGFSFPDSPGVSGSVTYKVRLGSNAGQAFYINGTSTGRTLGGSSKTNIILKEIL